MTRRWQFICKPWKPFQIRRPRRWPFFFVNFGCFLSLSPFKLVYRVLPNSVNEEKKNGPLVFQERFHRVSVARGSARREDGVFQNERYRVLPSFWRIGFGLKGKKTFRLCSRNVVPSFTLFYWLPCSKTSPGVFELVQKRFT